MKAVVYSEYGGPEVLQLTEVEKPSPAANEILVRVHAAALNPVDWHFVRGAPYLLRMASGGFKRPNHHRRVGCDYSGTIAAIGRDVTGFTAGQTVFGMGKGSLAEFLAVAPERDAVLKPERLTFEQAASVGLAGLTALQVLRDKARVQPGQKVLIVGAGGGIGTFAVQIAKAFGADVTGVQSTTAHDLVRSLGADHLIDYTKEDFTSANTRYDVIFDNVSTHSLPHLLRALKPGGILIPNGGGSPDTGISVRRLMRMIAMRPFISQKIRLFVTKPNRADLQVLADLLAAGTVTPVIDRCYPLSAAAEAFRHLESGHAHGKIVVTIAPLA